MEKGLRKFPQRSHLEWRTRWTAEAPRRRQRIGGVFDVGNLLPAAVTQVGVGKFVCDHVIRKSFGSFRQSSAKHDTTAAVPAWPRAIHPQRPTFAWYKRLHRNAKPRVVEKITLYSFRQRVQYMQYALAERPAFVKGFEICREDVLLLPAFFAPVDLDRGD